MAYKGFFSPVNKHKYEGNPHNIVYRSLWERNAFKWADHNPDVEKWSSEEFFIPYKCRSDNRLHRYFPDIKLTFTSGNIILVEIKPEKQTRPPIKRNHKTFLKEGLTYAKNVSKWEAADKYCQDRGWSFQIWTETTLHKIGIRTGTK